MKEKKWETNETYSQICVANPMLDETGEENIWTKSIAVFQNVVNSSANRFLCWIF